MFESFEGIRAAARDLPRGDASAAAAASARQAVLAKPAGSLGRLESLVAWLARWQGRARPALDHVQVLVAAGRHGVASRGVSAYPEAVTVQMVANFAAGGAAINQLARLAGARLEVLDLTGAGPAADLAEAPALSEAAFCAAAAAGARAVPDSCDLLCLGEMGIGNSTAAAALAAALFGGDGAAWAGRGTGVDEGGLAAKRAAVDSGLARSAGLRDPLALAAGLGGHELAALFGAALAARRRGVPVLLDGFICTAAVAPLAPLAPGSLDHCQLAHRSAEAGHARLAGALGLEPLLDLGLRLGEGSGAALAVPLLRAALACHDGMATFEEAAVSDRA